MRRRIVCLAACILAGTVASVYAQPRRPLRVPRAPLFRVAANVGQQVTSSTLTEEQTFTQYLEQGSFSLERTIPQRVFYDVGIAVRIVEGLHVGWTATFFNDKGVGQVTAEVPHPLQFNQQRTTTGEISGVARKETGHHLQILWTAPAAYGIEFTFFGGPSIFVTEQVFATRLNIALDQEVFPFDTLAFPGVSTETIRDDAFGYHAGVDLTRRLNRQLGIGILIRYSHAKKEFTPTDGQSLSIEVGGLHAGGGLRISF